MTSGTAAPGAARTREAPGGDAGIAELLWGLRGRVARGPKPTLSIDRIGRAAMSIADTGGLQAVTMHRVAAELKVTKMALYRYVTSKAELLAIMIEQAVGEPPDLDTVTGGWRPKLTEWARCMWAAWDQHPWLPGTTTGERIMGPNETKWTECALAALAGTRLNGREQIDAVALLSGHIRATRAATVSGTQPWTSDTQRQLLMAHASGYPATAAALASAATVPAGDTREFGLACILDGIGKLIADHLPARKRPPPR
jgi:AcrR family transcriptional regulator